MLHSWLNLLPSALCLLAFLPSSTQARSGDLDLEVLFIEMPGFEDALAGRRPELLKAVEDMFDRKFGLDLRLKLGLSVPGEEILEQAAGTPAFEDAGNRRLRPGDEPSPAQLARALDFLESYDIQDLRAFFPVMEDPDVTQMLKELLGAMAEKQDKLLKMKDKSGTPLRTPNRPEWHSALAWRGALFSLGRADIYILPQALIHDDPSQPYPHRVLAPGPLGGTTLEQRRRGPLAGRGVLLSTQWASDEWEEELSLKGLGLKEKTEILGGYLLAHEIAHAALKIPDVYDHPDACLMKTGSRDFDLKAAWKRLEENPGKCPDCKPYVSVMKNVWKADLLREALNNEAALARVQKAAKSLPAKLDGGDSFRSKLYLRQAELHLALAQTKDALSMIDNFLELNPDNRNALKLRSDLVGLLREESVFP